MKKRIRTPSFGQTASDSSGAIAGEESWTAARKRSFHQAVLNWYDQNGRRLPWRDTQDPYRIWLSEIMLQQTTVAAVVPYFERFLLAFPTVIHLAESDVDQVLRLWEGLGYYSRARNLHRAAQKVCKEHDGQFPKHPEQLQALPGVGRYTAGAIASFAFNLPAPIVEANTERLYARLMGLTDDIKSSQSQKKLWSFAEMIASKNRAGDMNQALMDLGSSVCTPQDPDCSVCPLVRFCRAFSLNRQNEIPVRKPRVAVTEVEELAVVLYHRGKVLLRRRGENERWSGLWDVPRIELTSHDLETLSDLLMRMPGKKKSHDTSARSLFQSDNLVLPERFSNQIAEMVLELPEQPIAAMEFKYLVTRYRVHLTAVLCSTVSRRTAASKNEDSIRWFALPELSTLPMSQTGRRIADWSENAIEVSKAQRE